MNIMRLYIIISGLLMAIWFAYKRITEDEDDLTLLEFILILIGGMCVGWVAIPIIILTQIKIKNK